MTVMMTKMEDHETFLVVIRDLVRRHTQVMSPKSKKFLHLFETSQRFFN